MATRFDCYIPGSLRIFWLMMRHRNEWQQRCLAVVTDTQTGYRFQVTGEENAIMDIAAGTSQETPMSEALAMGRQIKRALELMTDELFLAMYERRQGNEDAWSRFANMD